MSALAVDAAQVLSFRIRAQQLERRRGSLSATAILDIGAQDTGPDGAAWALAIRGVPASAISPADVLCAWTVRGAPHLYRRGDAAAVAAAVAPYSDSDAAKRIFDASKPLKAAGIAPIEALDAVAREMRAMVTEPMVKGAVSAALAKIMPTPYLRYCRPCDATHLYEMPFRLSALRAGLELQMGTSPPVLEPIPGALPEPSAASARRADVVRGYLRLLGPATPRQVAAYLDAPVRAVQEHWPTDVESVSVDGSARSILAADREALAGAPAPDQVRLLGPFDLFLQARDRDLLAPQAAHAKALWPVLGRPGAVLAGPGIVGTWRARKRGQRLDLAITPWRRLPAATVSGIQEQAARLAAFRGVELGAVDVA